MTPGNGQLVYPGYIRPMLAKRAPKPFDSSDYLFEVKWDGFRCIVFRDGAGVRLQSRNLKDLTHLFPELSSSFQQVDHPVVVDGEIIVFESGKPDFQALQRRGRAQRPGGQLTKKYPARYAAFDLLYLGADSLMDLPLTKRRQALTESLPEDEHLFHSFAVCGQGLKLAKTARELGLEGIIAKQKDSRYLPGKRSRWWLKMTFRRSIDCVILGYIPSTSGGLPIASLAVGAYDPKYKDFTYLGQVSSGLGVEDNRLLYELLTSHLESNSNTRRSPYLGVTPVLVCTVEYLEVTREIRLRHPVFIGMRTDKSPEECTIDQLTGDQP